MRNLILVSAVVILSACETTPEQKQMHEENRARYAECMKTRAYTSHQCTLYKHSGKKPRAIGQRVNIIPGGVDIDGAAEIEEY